MSADLVPAGAEGRSHGTVPADGTGIGNERIHASGVNRTEAAGNIERGFTVEQAIRTAIARIGVEAAFQNKANLVAVAQFLNALQAPAGARGVARFHREGPRRSGITQWVALPYLQIREAGVDTAVERNAGSKGGAGEQSRGNRKSNLLVHVVRSLKECAESPGAN